MKKDTIEIRWHGRGGQGAITAAKIVASAAFESGYAGVVMAPTFGTERRGAPVFTSLKLSKNKIYDLSPILNPDIVVVLDHLLLSEADVTNGLKPEGLIVLNTNKPSDEYNYNNFRMAVSDITSIADEAGLPKGMVNSGIIGSFSKATGFIDFDLIIKKIKDEFKDRKPKENAMAAMLAYERTIIGGN
ncbi:MAG: ketoisovalerate oxidoreductase [Deltaproteobacteria bacterium]|nr:MAG: ketoisovalerate oxidoreductase [Deltaproteobacteria bacterium]